MCKIVNIFLSVSLTFASGARKNRLIERALLSTHNMCFCQEIGKVTFNFAFLSGGLGV